MRLFGVAGLLMMCCFMEVFRNDPDGNLQDHPS